MYLQWCFVSFIAVEISKETEKNKNKLPQKTPNWNDLLSTEHSFEKKKGGKKWTVIKNASSLKVHFVLRKNRMREEKKLMDKNETRIWWARDDNVAPAKGRKQATTRRANDEILEEMKNKNKKLLKRLECLTSSIIDRVLNVFKMKQVNHIKKSTKDENIKGEKIFTNEALKQEKDVNVRNWNSFRFQGWKLRCECNVLSRNFFVFASLLYF